MHLIRPFVLGRLLDARSAPYLLLNCLSMNMTSSSEPEARGERGVRLIALPARWLLRAMHPLAWANLVVASAVPV